MSDKVSPRVLAVIPARGGSKSVPRKNIVPLGGKPLIAHMIGHALQIPAITDLVVSTEDEEIAEIAREYGAQVPFKRPAELSTDLIPSLPVVQHAVREMEALTGGAYDHVVLLQCNAPLCRPEDIAACLERLQKGDCDSVVAVAEAPFHPYRAKRIIDEDILVNFIDQGFEDMRPRQVLPPAYKRAGSVYASTRATIMDQETLVGANARAVVVPAETAIDIDTPRDLDYARQLFDKKNKGS